MLNFSHVITLSSTVRHWLDSHLSNRTQKHGTAQDVDLVWENFPLRLVVQMWIKIGLFKAVSLELVLYSGGLLIPSNVSHPDEPSLNHAVMSAHTCRFWITIHWHLFLFFFFLFFLLNRILNGHSSRIYCNLKSLGTVLKYYFQTRSLVDLQVAYDLYTCRWTSF